MLCRLCINDCSLGDTKPLYDDKGKYNDVHKVVALYFEAQLHELEGEPYEHQRANSRVICVSCWTHISDFHSFQRTVLDAQERYLQLIRFGEVVKLEMEMELSPLLCDVAQQLNTKNEEDPVSNNEQQSQIKHETDALEEKVANADMDEPTVSAAVAAAVEYSTDDEKPLLTRWNAKRQRQCTKQSSKSKTKAIAVKSKRKPKSKVEVDDTCEEQKAQNNKRQEQDNFIAEHWKRKLPCELCDKTSADFSSLRQHFREVHRIAKAYVVCCRRKYCNPTHLVEHLQIHMNPEYFKCTECGKCSANRRSLSNHMKSKHAQEPIERKYECEVCHKRFAKKGVLNGHMDVHATGEKVHVCKHCGKGFVLETRLNIHIRNVHNNDYSNVCELCGKSLRCRYSFKRHLLEHEGIKQRLWPCDLCDAQLHTKFSLGRHKRLAHADGSTVYVCGECGKVARTDEALRSHKRYMHEKERKYKCNICDKAFKVAVGLREHMTTHTGEDLYKCPHCPRTFKVNANMHHHRKRVHPKEWEAGHHRRALATSIDMSIVSNEIVM